jgi:hypothetical protein
MNKKLDLKSDNVEKIWSGFETENLTQWRNLEKTDIGEFQQKYLEIQKGQNLPSLGLYNNFLRP